MGAMLPRLLVYVLLRFSSRRKAVRADSVARSTGRIRWLADGFYKAALLD